MNHECKHAHGGTASQEEGTITTPFDMTVLNELDRFHLVMDTIDRVPQTGDAGVYLEQQLRDKLIEHKEYIDKNGEDPAGNPELKVEHPQNKRGMRLWTN